MGRRRWQKIPHTNWACRFARSDEQGGLGQIHVDSGRTHRPRTCRGWPDPQAAAGPRGPAKSRRRANWLPAGRHPPGPMPPAPGVEPAPARGYALPGSGHPRRSKDECLCGWFSSPPIPLRPRLHASPPSLYRFTAGPRPGGGRPGWLGGWLGGQPEGAQKYIMTPRPPTHHPVDYLPIFRVSMAAPAWHIARSAGSPALESVTHPLEHHLPGTGPHPSPPESQGSPQPRELGCRGRASPKRQAPRRPKASAKNARPRPCQAGDQQRASHQGILPRQLAPQVFGSPAAQDLTHRAPHVQAAARQAPPLDPPQAWGPQGAEGEIC